MLPRPRRRSLRSRNAEHAYEQQGRLGARRCFGNLLQEEDIFIGILSREFEVLAELVHDQQEAARSAGGGLDEQVGGRGARGCRALEQSACPACDGAGSCVPLESSAFRIAGNRGARSACTSTG